MNERRIITSVGLVMAVSVTLAVTRSQSAAGRSGARAQDEPAPTKPKIVTAGKGQASIQAIDEEYNRQLLELEKQRLEKLGGLAAR
jgi:hypothetical protein